MLAVFTVKKAALICDQGASAPPNQNPPEIGGCVDVMNPDYPISGNSNHPNITDYRFNEYLFTGEQLAELVVARDLDGAQFLASTASLWVDNASVVTCSDVTSYRQSDGKNYTTGALWFGHDVSSLLAILPPAMGISDPTGFSPTFDKIYQCILTVTPSMVGNPSSVAVQVSDVEGNKATSDVQKWYFNPAIVVSVNFDSGSAIQFPAAQPGQTVYSTNTLLIKNIAAGGVDLAVYLTGNDLVDTSGIGQCPTSNVLNVNNLAYRCKVGTYMSEKFTPLQHLKTGQVCLDFSARHCLVENVTATPTFKINDLLPDASSAFTSLLYNQHTAECWFQLNVPLPCIGSFSASDAVDILVRAI
jgi:hypothetical protein